MKIAEFVVKAVQRSLVTANGSPDVIQQTELVVFERTDPHSGRQDADSFALNEQTDHVAIGGQIPPPLCPARIGQRYALVLLPSEPSSEGWEPKSQALVAIPKGWTAARLDQLEKHVASLLGRGATLERPLGDPTIARINERLGDLERRVEAVEKPLSDVLRWHADFQPIGSTG